MPLRFAALFEHLNKGRYFRFQDVGRKWLEDVIDAAEGIPMADMNIAFTDGRQKDNRSVFGFLAFPDQRCRLKPVHIGHFNVQQNDRNFIPEKVLQRFHA